MIAYVSPSAQRSDTEASVKDMRKTDEESLLIVNIGSSDIFCEGAASQDVIEQYRELIATLKDRFSNIIIIMISALPHMYESPFALSRANGIDSIVQELCS